MKLSSPTITSRITAVRIRQSARHWRTATETMVDAGAILTDALELTGTAAREPMLLASGSGSQRETPWASP
ncbi:MAG: hypothetical protein NVS3B24_00570 [Candidatus Dormibacteria bacterium]